MSFSFFRNARITVNPRTGTLEIYRDFTGPDSSEDQGNRYTYARGTPRVMQGSEMMSGLASLRLLLLCHVAQRSSCSKVATTMPHAYPVCGAG